MNKVQKQQSDGFTIIEVVLVLAIAALIMLMVFIALPALQRSQRDTARTNDISRLQSAINNYKSQNRGRTPTKAIFDDTTSNGFLTRYLRTGGDQFADPGGEDYRLSELPTGNISFTAASLTNVYDPSDAANYANISVIWYRFGGKCNFDNSTVTNGSNNGRKVVLIKGLEGGGVQCVEA